ncbi:potassium voltage-gated channel subfamily H member 8, partial [Eurytemora carolleeae]|uniref:potassium voltage-gated channel subfamily H member 8 n=1 Tax=Eurytemora carolleeae TaxID=1294199 RepID=UPI000C75C1A6
MPRLVEGITPRKGLMAPQNNFLDKIAKRFKGTHANFVLGNAAIGPDFPIVYCSDGFCELTGQNRAAVMRQPVHCPFLYGQATDTRHRAEVETALRESKELKLSIQLYADPGIPFWCLLDIIPIRNEFGKVVLFLLSFKNITETYSASRNPSTYSLDSRLEFEPLDSEDTKKSFSRRRSRAVLSELSGCYIYQEPKQTGRREGRRHFSRFLSSSSAPIYKTARMQERCGIISHYGSFRKVGSGSETRFKFFKFSLRAGNLRCWDFVILVAIMYVALIVPYNAAFNRDPDGECSRTNLKPSIACDILVEMIFILDIFFNFRMSFINKKGEVVYKLKDIAINYITGWFLLDLFAALPFDLLYATCLIDNMDNFTSVDILKLTRLVRLARFIQKMDRLSQYSAVILTMLMIFFGFIAHWLACIWFVIGVNHTEEHPTGWMKQLAAENDLENITMVPKMDSYITALYFTCTSLTTVGFGNVAGNTRIEKLFCIFVMFVGALMHATIFGNVASIVGRIYVRRQEYDRKMLDLDHFAKIHKIPKDIRHRMEDHLQTKWFFNNGINYEISAEYPNCLRGEICAHIHKEVK